jgi:adenosine deaminase/adenosine deaminase CECR1
MKKIAHAIILAMALFSVAVVEAKDLRNDSAQHNYQLTKKFYQGLIDSGNPNNPQLAELNLLMTMLPKGGDIHHHYTGALYAETYLDWVDKQGFCVYRTDDPAKRHEKYRIDSSPQGAGPTDKDCLKADAIRQDTTFYRELLMRWSDKDFANHSHEQPAPDQQFFDTFGFFSPAAGYSAVAGLQILKQQAKADNVQYLETMLKSAPSVDNPALAARIDALPPDADPAIVGKALASYADFLDSDADAQQKIADYKSALASYAAEIDDADFTLRFQSYVSRNNPPAQVFAGLYSAFAAAHGSKLIVGVNIVGPENGVVAMRDYNLHMQMFHLLKQRYPDVHLSMHAGELTLGMVPPEGLRDHIRNAVEIAGAERIGHGIDVTYENNPVRLLEEMQQRHVAVEICLSSNAFILGVEQKAHPVTVYLRHKVPFVIATDDAGVSRSNIGAEYLLFVSRYKPSYDVLKQVVYNSIHYAFIDPAEKKLQLQQLDRRFIQFEAAAAKLADGSPRPLH